MTLQMRIHDYAGLIYKTANVYREHTQDWNISY